MLQPAEALQRPLKLQFSSLANFAKFSKVAFRLCS
jgi:hypothetical protein